MKKTHTTVIRNLNRIIISIILTFASVAFVPAQAQVPTPTFSMTVSPDTIGPGSAARVTFVIDNTLNPAPAVDLAFTLTLPAGVTFASPASPSTSCIDGLVSAPDGGSVLTFTGGKIGIGELCEITVYVTSSASGTHTLSTGDLTSDLGNSGFATDDLTVNLNRLGFAKNFTPSSVTKGIRSRLTFEFDNQHTSAIFFNSFIDALPEGLIIADPANITWDPLGNMVYAPFPGALVAEPGTNLVSLPYSAISIPTGTTAALSLDVIGTSIGVKSNITSDLFSLVSFSPATGGLATANIEITTEDLLLTKAFLADPIPAGSNVDLKFTLFNRSRGETATNLTFSDDLGATLTGLSAIGLPLNDVCGPGSLLSFNANVLTLSNGTLGPGETCEFTVPLMVPSAAATGAYPNVTTPVTADLGVTLVVGNIAADTLFVAPVPLLTKSFMNDPVVSSGTVDLEFTITNTSLTSSATDIAFEDVFFVGLPTAVTVPANGSCGPGSIFTFTPLLDTPGNPVVPAIFSLSSGSLAPAGQAGDSCTFTLTLNIAPDTPNGTYLNTTSPITATVDGGTYTGKPASDNLIVVAPPQLTKSFSDDPVMPGNDVTLEYTISLSPEAPSDATDIQFTDDLSVLVPALPGLTVTPFNATDICGTGSIFTDTTGTVLNFSGGTLSPGETCTFSVIVHVPANAIPGSYVSTSDPISATIGGLTPTGNSAVDTLDITSLTLEATYTDDPAAPGETVTIEYTITNDSPTLAATGIIFLHDYNAVLSGMVPVPPAVPDPPCGAGSSATLVGNQLTFSGGTLAPLTSCTFSVTLQVPLGAAPGNYASPTQLNVATVDGQAVTFPAGTDTLEIIQPLSLTKSFTDDPAVAGGTATLEFTVFNTHPSQAITNITFTDDLNATLTGLVATGLPIPDPCSSGTLTGTSLITFSGGTLAAGASCTFSVVLAIPAGVAPGTLATNTTSAITGSLGSVNLTGDPANDVLQIEILEFNKSFAADTAPTGTTTLTFSITNHDPINTMTDLNFTDDLGAMMPGMVAVGLPSNDVCGTGATLSGTSVITLIGGSLGPGQTCVFNATVAIPGTASPGVYTNTTSALNARIDGGPVTTGQPAIADLTVNPSPLFSKSFAANPILEGGMSTLTFTIDNTTSTIDATNLDFTDNLPAGLFVSSTPGPPTCSGGTLTATPGSSVISYTGGTVAAGSSCTVSVIVTSSLFGNYNNTSGNLTSSSGDSGTASDTLRVNALPRFSKNFSDNPNILGGTSTLTFTVDNTNSSVAATALDFTDNLPPNITVATPSNASSSCTSGTLTAVSGTGVISYTGGSVSAGSICTVSVDVTPSTVGNFTNTTGNLTSSMGNSGPASDTLVVNPAPLFSKSFMTNPVNVGSVTTLTFTIDNSGSTADATALDFTDNMPANLVVAPVPNANITCTGGILTATPGSGVISYTGGTLNAGGTCTLSVDVISNVPGSYANTSGSLTSSLGTSISASDTLEVTNVADLSVAWTGPPSAHPDDLLNYTLTVSNAGPSDALNTLVSATFAPGLTGVSWTCAGTGLATCTGSGTGNILDTVDLPSGTSVTYAISGTVDTAFLGNLDLVALATPGGTVVDPDPANNGLTFTTVSTSPSILSGTLVASELARAASLVVEAGDTVLLDAVITNEGLFTQFDDPTSDEFSLTVPAGLGLINATLISGGGVLTTDLGTNTVTWNGAILSLDTVTLQVETIVEPITSTSAISVQGMIQYDGDGDGLNDTITVTDDPAEPGPEDPTLITLLMSVPALPPLGLAIFIILLAIIGVVMMRRLK